MTSSSTGGKAEANQVRAAGIINMCRLGVRVHVGHMVDIRQSSGVYIFVFCWTPTERDLWLSTPFNHLSEEYTAPPAEPG